MSAPTAADYAAALAVMDTVFVVPGADELEAALTYVRARLAADEAQERRMEARRGGGWRVYGLQAMGEMEIDCERRDEAADKAYRALIALAANTDGAP